MDYLKNTFKVFDV